MTNNDELAQLKQLATFMTERFSMNPVSCKILNEDWKKRLPDDAAVAETLVALLAERDADKKRIAELEQNNCGGALMEREEHHVGVVNKLLDRIAELEARTVSVKLPEVITVYTRDYGNIDVMSSEDVEIAIAAAGIKLEVGE